MHKLHIFFISLIVLFSACIGSIHAQVVSENPSQSISAGKERVTSIALAPKGDRILVGMAEDAVLLDLKKGKKVHTFTYDVDGTQAVYYAAFNENGEYVVTIGMTGKKYIWDVKSGKKEENMSKHRWAPDPREIKAMGFEMGNSAFDYYYQQTEAQHPSLAIAAKSQGSKIVFTDESGNSLQTLDFTDIVKDDQHLFPCYFSPNGKEFITGDDNGKILFYSIIK